VCSSRDQPSGRDGISVVRATPVPVVVNSRSCSCLLNARDKISNLPLLAESSQTKGVVAFSCFTEHLSVVLLEL